MAVEDRPAPTGAGTRILPQQHQAYFPRTCEAPVDLRHGTPRRLHKNYHTVLMQDAVELLLGGFCRTLWSGEGPTVHPD